MNSFITHSNLGFRVFFFLFQVKLMNEKFPTVAKDKTGILWHHRTSGHRSEELKEEGLRTGGMICIGGRERGKDRVSAVREGEMRRASTHRAAPTDSRHHLAEPSDAYFV